MIYYLAEIIRPPQDTAVFLDQPAMFICETIGGDFTGWRVNGSSISDLLPEIVDDLKTGPGGVHNYELNITARVVYNGTTVQCVTGKIEGVPVESENVTLKIQGIQTVLYSYISNKCA